MNENIKKNRIKMAANKCKEHCINTIIDTAYFSVGNGTESAHKVLKGNAEHVRPWAYGKNKFDFVKDIDNLITEIQKSGNYANGHHNKKEV